MSPVAVKLIAPVAAPLHVGGVALGVMVSAHSMVRLVALENLRPQASVILTATKHGVEAVTMGGV